MTSSAVDGIHQPTWAGLAGTPRAPAVTDSASAGAAMAMLGIRTEVTPTGSTAGRGEGGGTGERACWPRSSALAPLLAVGVAVAAVGWAQAGGGPALGKRDW